MPLLPKILLAMSLLVKIESVSAAYTNWNDLPSCAVCVSLDDSATTDRKHLARLPHEVGEKPTLQAAASSPSAVSVITPSPYSLSISVSPNTIRAPRILSTRRCTTSSRTFSVTRPPTAASVSSSQMLHRRRTWAWDPELEGRQQVLISIRNRSESHLLWYQHLESEL